MYFPAWKHILYFYWSASLAIEPISDGQHDKDSQLWSWSMFWPPNVCVFPPSKTPDWTNELITSPFWVWSGCVRAGKTLKCTGHIVLQDPPGVENPCTQQYMSQILNFHLLLFNIIVYNWRRVPIIISLSGFTQKWKGFLWVWCLSKFLSHVVSGSFSLQQSPLLIRDLNLL